MPVSSPLCGSSDLNYASRTYTKARKSLWSKTRMGLTVEQNSAFCPAKHHNSLERQQRGVITPSTFFANCCIAQRKEQTKLSGMWENKRKQIADSSGALLHSHWPKSAPLGKTIGFISFPTSVPKISLWYAIYHCLPPARFTVSYWFTYMVFFLKEKHQEPTAEFHFEFRHRFPQCRASRYVEDRASQNSLKMPRNSQHWEILATFGQIIKMLKPSCN